MALLHEEVSEAGSAWRKHGLDDQTSPIHPSAFSVPKPEGVGSEFADILIRLLDDCERFGVHLYTEYERKMEYNRTRPFRHGGLQR